LEAWLSSTAPALQVQSPEFKSCAIKKRQKKDRKLVVKELII
jgi:hypothetical protein